MRDLTPEELALAPDCCDMYFINYQSLVVYVNSRTNECHASLLDEPIILGDCYYGYQIMRQIKPFDITQHEWSDEFTYFDFELHKDRGGIIIGGEVNRSDIIAIAKHLKLTAEDLK